MLEEVFVASVVLLCPIHVLRYFKDKVFTGKAYWGDAGDKNYLAGGEKEELMKLLASVRDAPSEELYLRRERDLVEMTKSLTVRPGQVTKPVEFLSYYQKNWKSCSFRWVFAYRKNLATQGANDTQAAESTFRAIKHYTKVEFGNRIPTLSELCTVLPKLLDKRTAEREQNINLRRLVIHHPDPEFEKALQTASWKLNAAGMRRFHECLKMAEFKKPQMTLQGNQVEEKYVGKNTAKYVGHYETDGLKCNCSWFKSKLICRHPFFYRMMNSLPLFDLNIFPPCMLLDPADEVFEDGESEDMIAESDEVTERLGSPGMEHLIEEEQRANKKMKKNVKFNKAFDVAKVAAEYTSMYSGEAFDTNLEAFKQFTDLMRIGLPVELVDTLERLTKAGTAATAKDLVPQPPPSCVQSEQAVVDHIAVIPPPPRPSNVFDLPPNHTYELSHHFQGDLVGYRIPGDGACFYGSCAAHIYQDEKQVDHLRRLCHFYLVQNWDYYKLFIPFPFTEKVGVGSASYRVCFEDEEELKGFFLREESLKCFSTSNLDYAIICNMFNITISVFTYGNIYNYDEGLRLTVMTPDPVMAEHSPYVDPSIQDMILYHADDSHYDLLVFKASNLAVHGSISMMFNLEHPYIDEVDEEETLEVDEEETLNDVIISNTPNLKQIVVLNDGVSPLIFKPCPRGPGRPKTKRLGQPHIKPAAKRPMDDVEEPVPKKKRGRPAGSKNKPKGDDAVAAVPKTKPKKSLRRRAEEAASNFIEDDLFADSEDVCIICNFRFNDPIKRNKSRARCPDCDILLHKPCLEKSGCVCSDLGEFVLT